MRSAAITLGAFNAAIVISIQMVSWDTTLTYITVDGTSVISHITASKQWCPSPPIYRQETEMYIQQCQGYRCHLACWLCPDVWFQSQHSPIVFDNMSLNFGEIMPSSPLEIFPINKLTQQTNNQNCGLYFIWYSDTPKDFKGRKCNVMWKLKISRHCSFLMHIL